MSYQSMKDAFLRLIGRGQRERAEEPAFNADEVLRTFRAQPNDAARFVYYRSLPLGQANALFSARAVNFGQWVNAMDYNVLLGGFSPSYLRWTPNGIIGPNGPLPKDAQMTWATFDGKPAFNGELVVR